ncbi:MAG: IS256 family transposase [Acidimicrobiia bacterium]
MGTMPRLVARGKKDRRLGEPSEVGWEEIEALGLDPRVELIRQLIPLGLAEVGRLLEEEVDQLAGLRHARKPEDDRHYRHGHNPGSVKLGGQRHPVRVPRVRGPAGESRLESYERLHGSAGEVDEGLFRKVLLGISCRDYETAVEAVPGAIGLSKSTVSREFKKATAAKLKAFQERDLSDTEMVALVLDGKSFADDEMVVALGVTIKGDKVFLGFVQTDTENAVVIRSFLRGLKDRGLDLSAGALVVIDGAKGLRSGVLAAFPGQVLIQRCQWHKRENVISHLPRAEQKSWRRRLQRAYQRPTYDEAVRDLKALREELREVNQSAVASLDEGFEETLTLHRLGVFPLVGRSLKTTNALESVNALAEQRCGRVDHWKNSGHKHRWLATALLEIEPRLRRLLGYRHLPLLRTAIQKDLGINLPECSSHAVA